MQVAVALALDILDAFALEPEHRAGLRASGNFYFRLAAQGGDFNVRTERGLDKTHRDFAQKIVASLWMLGGQAAGTGNAIYPGDLITLGMKVLMNSSGQQLPHPICLSAEQTGDSGAFVEAHRPDDDRQRADHQVRARPGRPKLGYDAGGPAPFADSR